MTHAQRRSELLMPAGDLAKLKTAVLYGADAIYMGTPDMSLRTKSKFSLEEVVEGIEYAHAHGVRVYLTLNLFSHNKDISKLPEYVETVRRVKPDGLIVADPGVFMFVKEQAPELELHVSTQANVCSWQSVKFWEKQGAKLCVLGREVSFAELEEIREKCPDIKLEAFVHGSMCMTYSGRCLLSNFMAERGANQGACANSCRWKYKVKMRLKDGTTKELPLTEENLELFEFLLEEEVRPGELMPIEEDDRGSYILNSKDLCIMPKLDDYLRIGVDSLKIEGRGKSPYYVALVARAYRMAIDAWYEDPENWNADEYMSELLTVPSRGYSYAFHEGRLSHHSHGYEHTETLSEWEYAAVVREVREDAFIIEAKNRLLAGDVLEFIPPSAAAPVLLRVYEFERLNTRPGNGKRGRHAKRAARVARALGIYSQTVLEEAKKVVSPGHDSLLRIPFSLFDQERSEQLASQFPVGSIIRKEKPLTEEQWDRLAFDKAGMRRERGESAEGLITLRRDKLRDSVDARDANREVKSRRVGTDGCCGKGCNGCLIFWHDSSYQKARELLATKKQGEMLSNAPALFIEAGVVPLPSSAQKPQKRN
ncbi:MAG: peptidase U32 [Myxococcales bacterium]|nr:peptidase U32 [Myxococcales bacterium]